MTVMYSGPVRPSTCPHDGLSTMECDGVHIPPQRLCPDCADEWLDWHQSRGHDPQTYWAKPDTRTCPPPCPGFKSPGVKLAPFKPGEDPITDKTRSTLGRLFGGDITE